MNDFYASLSQAAYPEDSAEDAGVVRPTCVNRRSESLQLN